MRTLILELISLLGIAAFSPRSTAIFDQWRLSALGRKNIDSPQLPQSKEPQQKKGSLLLVDDEVYLRKAVKAYLEDRGYEVRTVGSAADALREIRRDTPDLMIADITMPAVDGYQLVLQLRRYPEFVTLPVIFLTARGMVQDRIQGYQSGCDAYVTKPFDPEELVAVIKNFLARENHHRGELRRLREELDEAQKQLWKRSEATRADISNPAQGGEQLQLKLSDRQQEVLNLLAKGKTNREIAGEVFVVQRTVERRLKELLQMTNTTTRTDLLRFADANGLITPM